MKYIVCVEIEAEGTFGFTEAMAIVEHVPGWSGERPILHARSLVEMRQGLREYDWVNKPSEAAQPETE